MGPICVFYVVVHHRLVSGPSRALSNLSPWISHWISDFRTIHFVHFVC